MSGHQSLDDFGNLLLLASRELGDPLKSLVEATARSDDAPRLGLAKKFLDGDTERTGHWNQHVGTRRVAALLPIANVRLILTNLPGQFALRKTSGLSKGFET